MFQLFYNNYIIKSHRYVIIKPIITFRELIIYKIYNLMTIIYSYFTIINVIL